MQVDGLPGGLTAKRLARLQNTSDEDLSSNSTSIAILVDVTVTPAQSLIGGLVLESKVTSQVEYCTELPERSLAFIRR
jgi:hypothetical protein